MKTTITKIYRSDKDKEGRPLKTSDGRPYTRVGIKTQEHGEKWLSGFENYTNSKWSEGDQVDIEIEKRGEYLNFKSPSKLELLEKRLGALEDRVTHLEGNDIKEQEPDLDSIPF